MHGPMNVKFINCIPRCVRNEMVILSYIVKQSPDSQVVIG